MIFLSTPIDMYAKCGNVDMARMVFDRTLDKDVVVWSAMIVGYGLHGRGLEALDLYQLMKQTGVCPNDVTFLGLLTACNHSARVEDGWQLFHCMTDFGIEPRHQHYACVVDLLGCAGFLDQAFDFIMNMPIEPALQSPCFFQNVESCCKGRVLMREKGLSKDLGYSLIEINGKLQAFRVRDKSHPRSKEIYLELESLRRRLKQAGFIPHTDSSLHDLNSEEIEETLCNHSEGVAIAFGLISTALGTTLR
ncbi:hypothetical protein CRYUN_Cryun23aG0012300 [Craigia yunnanensis]